MNQGKLHQDEQRDWLRLIRSENVGPATFWKLINHYGSAADALAAIPELARQGGAKRRMQVCAEKDVDRELNEARKMGAQFVCAVDQRYPLSLKSIPVSPPVICVRGDLRWFTTPSIAIVGARNASASGRKLAEALARDLGRAGVVVVSGLARGIDAAAHRGSLETGTIAVLAGGANRPYPPENKELFAAIAQSGLIVSEQPINYTAQARDFPRRNRIVSGLALGVVVVEASLRSGSLITANFAADQGRDVFAVPGSPLDPRARGPNRLIRDGATLVETADDILQTLNTIRPHAQDTSMSKEFWPGDTLIANENTDDLPNARQKLAALLGPTPTTVDELIRLGDCPPAAVHRVLLELELAGHLERHSNGQVSRI